MKQQIDLFSCIYQFPVLVSNTADHVCTLKHQVLFVHARFTGLGFVACAEDVDTAGTPLIAAATSTV